MDSPGGSNVRSNREIKEESIAGDSVPVGVKVVLGEVLSDELFEAEK